jgi:methionyl aminopeptidase
MVTIKTKEEIKVLSLGGKILANILEDILKHVKPGSSTAYLEEIAVNKIIELGGRPAFKNYPLHNGLFFPSALCVSINDEVVHGSALPDRLLKSGDIVDLDIGMEWPIKEEIRDKFNLVKNPHSKLGGFYTDTCQTIAVGKISKEASLLLKVTKASLFKAIEIVKEGVYLHQIGKAIEEVVNPHGFGIVENFVGHGLGYSAHEDPDIYHYQINPNSRFNIKLKEGMVIAIEPMINLGSSQVKMSENNYTAITLDGSISAHFEHSLVVLKNKCQILTQK